jgi:hypothetical protein
MPGKIRVKITPKTVFLTPAGNGNFKTGNKPANDAFPVVTGIELSLEQNNGGTMPLAQGQKANATLELLSRVRNTTNTNAPYSSCGILSGELVLRGSPAAPVLTAKQTDPNNANQVITNFAPAATPNVARSDFLLDFSTDDQSIKIVTSNPIRLPLAWAFSETEPVLQLNARLSVNGTLETDVTGTDPNQPIDIPLKHVSVPDEGIAGQAANHPLLTFYGVRSMYTMTLFAPPARVKIPVGTQTVNVFLHDSVRALVPLPNVTELQNHVQTVLQDLGFATVNVDSGATAQGNFRTRFKQVQTPNSTRFMSINVPQAREKPIALDLEADKSPGFNPDTETTEVPFFDFYIVSQAVDPSAAAPDELGHSESIGKVTPPNKRVLTPIVLTAGSNNLAGMRKLFQNIDVQRQAIIVAQVICHEIGHSLGLRHGITFPGGTPYTFKDPTLRGTMGAAATPPPIAGNAIPVPFQFFGPVHQAAIRQWYL